MNDEPLNEPIDAGESEIVDLTERAEDSRVEAAGSSPGVDELHDRLRALQVAMDQLEAGDLDEAERAIDLLEDRIASLRG